MQLDRVSFKIGSMGFHVFKVQLCMLMALFFSAQVHSDTEITMIIQALQISGSTDQNTGSIYIYEDPYSPKITPLFSMSTSKHRAMYSNLISAMAAQRPVHFKSNISDCNPTVFCLFHVSEIKF